MIQHNTHESKLVNSTIISCIIRLYKPNTKGRLRNGNVSELQVYYNESKKRLFPDSDKKIIGFKCECFY